MGIDELLSRLSGVKSGHTIGRYIARCPAHEDKHPSLTIRVVDDGRILLHCFASCSTVDVMGALGLTLADLFPAPLTREYLPKIHAPFSALDALKCLAEESSVVAIAASDITLGRTMSDEDASRVCTAAGRIATALEVIHT
jgi:hypothetical protein